MPGCRTTICVALASLRNGNDIIMASILFACHSHSHTRHTVCEITTNDHGRYGSSHTTTNNRQYR